MSAIMSDLVYYLECDSLQQPFNVHNHAHQTLSDDYCRLLWAF